MSSLNEPKKRNTDIIRLLLCFAILLGVAFFTLNNDAFATSDTKEKMEEAEKKKEEKEKELEKAKADLEKTQENLAKLRRQKSSYQGQMAILNENLQEVADKLNVLENSISIKQIEIDETQAELADARARSQQQYVGMKLRIQFLYESGAQTYGELLLGADSFGEFINYADYVMMLSEYDRRMLEEYTANADRIAEDEQILQGQMSQLEELKAEVVAEQQKVNGLIDETASYIAKTADSIEATEAVEDDMEQEVEDAENEVDIASAEYEKIKKQYQEELARSRQARESKWRDISEVTFEEGDRYLLAHIIYCEAGNQPYEGQCAVGAVVINRVLSSVFPDTVTGVIYQRNQFSPVGNGRLAAALAEGKATAACYQAADYAMAGNTNVGNCVFFRTPIPGLEGIRIGGHIFY